MDTIVSTHGLTELLEMPPHLAADPRLCPKGRGILDRLTEIMWTLPREKRPAFVALAEAVCAQQNARRERRLDEEMMH